MGSLRAALQSYRYLKLAALGTAALLLVTLATSLRSWGLQRHLLELQTPELPVAQREVAAQAIWAIFQMNPAMRPGILRQSRGIDLWMDLLRTDSPILTECGGKLLYASMAMSSSYESDAEFASHTLTEAEVLSLAASLSSPACRDLCQASILFALELDSQQEGQPAKLAAVEGLAKPLMSAAGIKPAATSTLDVLQEPDWVSPS